jgi:alkylhydroperoxidase family enzyme
MRSGRRGATPSTFGPREQLVIEYAEQLTRTGTTTEDLDRRVRDVLRTPREIVELAAVVAIANAGARLENALKIEEV